MSLKRFIKRRSTKTNLRNAWNATRTLVGGLINQWRYGNDLRAHCHGRNGLLLNIGCGERVHPGWVNIDVKPRLGTLYHNILDPLPIEDRTVAVIHAEHLVEHLEYGDAVRFIAECHRILMPDGSMRVIIPDAEKYMNAYSKKDKVFFASLKYLGGSSEPLPTVNAICNQAFHMGGDHRFCWDFETFSRVAQEIGFASIAVSFHNDGSIGCCIDAQDWWRPIESLYINLSRPHDPSVARDVNDVRRLSPMRGSPNSDLAAEICTDIP
jgi:predicted SAM-dependent methyltransferase